MDNFTPHCKDPSKHAQKWQIRLPCIQQSHPISARKEPHSFCLACGVLILEDPYQLAMHKRLVLRTTYEILRNKPSDLSSILPEEEPVTIHILNILLEIVNGSSDEPLTSLAAELLRIAMKFHYTPFGTLHVEMLHSFLGVWRMKNKDIHLLQIQEERNFQRSVGKFQIIRKLLQVYPLISCSFHQHEGQFLHYLIGGLTYPSDAVKLSVVNILFLTYKSTSANDAGHFVHIQVAKSMTSVLNSTQDEDVLLNALGLMLHLIKDSAETLAIIFDNSSFASILKKILLSNRPELQICIAQCICLISRHQMAENYMNALMECSLPELLFELLGTTNEILLESILCCIQCFANYSVFFTKCHAMYGMESIIRTTSNLINAKNWRLTIVSLNLLATSFSSDISTASDGVVFHAAIELINCLCKVNDPSVLSVSSRFLSVFLRKNNLPWPLPASVLLSTLEIYFATIAKFLRISETAAKSRVSKPEKFASDKCSLKEIILRHSFEILKAMTRLSNDFSTHSVTMEEAFSCPVFGAETDDKDDLKNGQKTSYEGFLELSLTTIDKIFIPFTLNLKISTRIGQVTCAYLVATLSELYEHNWKHNDYLLEITQKIFCCGLLRCFFGFTNMMDFSLQKYISIDETKENIATCIYYMLRSILDKEAGADEAYLKDIKIGIKELTDQIENCTAILSEQCACDNPSQDLFNTTYAQLALLCLNYTSFKYGYGIVSEKVLLPHLVCFTLRNSELPGIPCIALKHMVYLLAVCSYDVFCKDGTFPTGFLEASRILLKVVSKLPSLSNIYTREKLIVWWCFIQENKSNFSLFVLNDWLSTSAAVFDEEKYFFLQLLSKNQNVQEIFMACFQSQETKTLVKAFSYLKRALTNEVLMNVDLSIRDGFKMLLERLVQQIPSILVNICLTANDEGSSFSDEQIVVLLECLKWCQQLVGAISQSEIESKLVFHITNFVSTKLPEDHVTLTACFKYLTSTINAKLPSDDHRAWHIISGHVKLLGLLEKCVTKESNTGLEEAALNLLGNIVNYQIRNGIQINKSAAQIKVPIAQIFKWLESSTHMQMITYSVLSCMIKSSFQKTVIQVVTSLHPFLESSRLFLSRSDFRQLFNYLQNAVIMGGSMKNIAIPCLINVMDFVRRRDPELEKHLMLQPCNRILLEETLLSGKIVNGNTKILFEMWLSYEEKNPFLIGVIRQFAENLCNIPHKQNLRTTIIKLCRGCYGGIISDAIKNHLHDEIKTPAQEHRKYKEITLFDNVEKLVQTCLGQSQTPSTAEVKTTKNASNTKKQRKTKAAKKVLSQVPNE